MVFVVLSTTTELLPTIVLGSINFPYVNGLMAIFKLLKAKTVLTAKIETKIETKIFFARSRRPTDLINNR